MKEKEAFIEPELEVIIFPEQDIVTTSGGVDVDTPMDPFYD